MQKRNKGGKKIDQIINHLYIATNVTENLRKCTYKFYKITNQLF